MKKTLLFVMMLVVSYTLYAQAPFSFNYQATVRDSDGNLLSNRTISLRITILQGSSSGTTVYSETQSASSSDYGMINLAIGKGSNRNGDLSLISWSDGPFYIKIELDPDGGSNYSNMGTAQLLSVPFAMYASGTASNGSSLWTVSEKDISYTEGKVGIGVTNPNSGLEIKGLQEFSVEDTLFLVKDKNGQPVFAVFEDGVEVYVDDQSKGTVGGFAVSGRSAGKASGYDIMKVTPDSTRIYVNDAYSKGSVGGFAVSGRSAGKGTSSKFLNLSPENYFIGHESGLNITTGTYNSFLGYQSGYSTTTGDRNVFLGYQSGYTNTDGIDNIFVGNKAGYYNQYGSYNVFIGDSSGTSNTIGRSNVIIGKVAGLSNTEGNFNLMLGTWAGKHNTTGSQNVFLGQQAGEQNTTGNYNVFLGTLAGDYNETGVSNVYIGRSAGHGNTVGSFNLALGTLSGQYNSDGEQNVFLGQQTGQYVESGSYNVYTGAFAGYNNTNGDFNVFLGYGAGYYETGSERLYIENSVADSNNALIYGNFNTDKLAINGNLHLGKEFMNIKGNPGTGIYPSYYVYQGSVKNSSSKQFAFAIYDALWVTSTAWFDSYIYADNYYTNSDKRYKKNITPIDNPVKKLMQINGVYHNWDTLALPSRKHNADKREVGCIAQELELVLPEVVHTDENGYKAVDYSKIVPLLIESVKAQQKEINELKQIIDKLVNAK